MTVKLLIITRYLLKEILGSLLAVTLILMLIFLSNQLVRFLSYAASGKISPHLVLQLMGFEIPYLLGLLLPLGLFIGIILAFGRLYADSEMPVLNACGVSTKRLIYITSIMAWFIALIVTVLMLWVNPLIAQDKGIGLAQNNMIDTLRPGRFQVLNEGKDVIYIEKISRNRKIAQNIFVAEEQKPKVNDPSIPWVVVSAAGGYQQKDPVSKNHFIVSTDGVRYEGTPGENAYKVFQFKKYAVRLPFTDITNPREEEEAIPTTKLWHDYSNPMSASELQWRLSIPLSVFVLMLLAVPLSQVKPRQGRFTSLFPAVLLYIVYVNLLFVARNWVELKFVPIFIGIWWVHFVLLSVGALLLYLQGKQLQITPLLKFGNKTI